MSEQSLPVVGDVVYQDIDPDLRLCDQYVVENIQSVNRWDVKNELWDVDSFYILRGVESGERCYVYGSSFYLIESNQCNLWRFSKTITSSNLWRFTGKHSVLSDGIQNLGVSSRGCEVSDSVETFYQQTGSCFPAGTLVTMADGTDKPIEEINVGGDEPVVLTINKLDANRGIKGVLSKYMSLVNRLSRNLYDQADIPVKDDFGFFLSKSEVSIRQLIDAGLSYEEYALLLRVCRPGITFSFEKSEFDAARRVIELRAEADRLQSELGYNV